MLAGSRIFELDGSIHVVSAGQALFIPAFCPHRSLVSPDGEVRCVNLYLPADPASIDIDDAMPIARIAEAAGLSREYFSRRFADAAGMPPHAWRRMRRLNAARRQLRSDEPIAAIAADLGFADQSHLGRVFRQAFGVTPQQYRTSMREVTNIRYAGLPAL